MEFKTSAGEGRFRVFQSEKSDIAATQQMEWDHDVRNQAVSRIRSAFDQYLFLQNGLYRVSCLLMKTAGLSDILSIWYAEKSQILPGSSVP